jgi:hypothetical protein
MTDSHDEKVLPVAPAAEPAIAEIEGREKEYLNTLRGWAQIESGREIDAYSEYHSYAEEAEALTEIRWQEAIDKVVSKVYPDRDGSGSDGDALALTLDEIGQAFAHQQEQIDILTAERDAARGDADKRIGLYNRCLNAEAEIFSKVSADFRAAVTNDAAAEVLRRFVNGEYTNAALEKWKPEDGMPELPFKLAADNAELTASLSTANAKLAAETDRANTYVRRMFEANAKLAEAEKDRDALAVICRRWPIDAQREYSDNPGDAFDNRRRLAREIVKRLGIEDLTEIAEKAASSGVPCGEAVVKGVVVYLRAKLAEAEAKVGAYRTAPEKIANGQTSLYGKYTPQETARAALSSPPAAAEKSGEVEELNRSEREMIHSLLARELDHLRRAPYGANPNGGYEERMASVAALEEKFRLEQKDSNATARHD